MPALDRLRGTRVVADPAAIDAWLAALPASTVVIRPAPDDAFAIDVERARTGDPDTPGAALADPHAIVVDEPGFVGGWCTLAELRHHLEWTPPMSRPILAQGSVAGVPAKLWIDSDDRVLLVAAAAYADVLGERLRWRR